MLKTHRKVGTYMKFISTSKSELTRSIMAWLFLQRAVEEKKLNEVVNLDEVISLLEPTKIIDSFLHSSVEDYK